MKNRKILTASILVTFVVLIYIGLKKDIVLDQSKISIPESITDKVSDGEMHEINSNVATESNSTELLKKERSYTEEEILKMDEETFLITLEDIKNRLPKKSDLKEIPKEALHHTPVQILNAGKNLGLIKEILKIHPDFEKSANLFYEKCASDSDSPTTIRAICLTNLIVSNSKNKTELQLSKYPKEIVELSKIVTDL